MDRNEAFATERTTQIATAKQQAAAFDQRVKDGKLVPLGKGQFRVTDPGSWDNGEILVQTKQGILPQHQLDMTTGKAALYSSVPTWHGAGTVVPGGTKDIDEVLHMAGLDWDVVSQPHTYTWKCKKRIFPDSFDLLRSDTGDGLGVVGKIYVPIQNRVGFTFLQDLVQEYGFVFESAGALRNGKRTFVSMRLPRSVMIDPEGLADEVIPFLALMNDHSGTKALTAVVSPWRPVCGNTERFALRDATAKWSVSHTTNALRNLEVARRTLGLSVKYFDSFAAEETVLAQSDLAMRDFEKLIDTLWTPPTIEDGKRAHTMYDNRKAELTALAGEARNFPGTAYGAERTLTEWLDHRGTKSDAVRATRIMEGADDDVKSTAHRQLLLMTNR